MSESSGRAGAALNIVGIDQGVDMPFRNIVKEASTILNEV